MLGFRGKESSMVEHSNAVHCHVCVLEEPRWTIRCVEGVLLEENRCLLY